MVVADQEQHPAMGAGAGGIGVADHVHRAVDAGALAIPHGEDAVVARAGEEAALLRAPDGGGRHVLVDARMEDDVVVCEMAAGALDLAVETGQRRATIAGDIAGRIQAGGSIAAALLDRQPHQRLRARQKHGAALKRVAFVKRADCRRPGCQVGGVVE